MYKTNWKDTEAFTDPNEAYKAFLERFLLLYDKNFPIRKIKIKAKDLESPWITNGIKKSSKKKQRLYQKFLKTRTEKNESEYKNYKKLFESVKKRSKKLHFSRLILKYQNNIKKTWNVIKDAIGKNNSTQSSFPNKFIHKAKTITDVHLIANHFNLNLQKLVQTLQRKLKNLL